MSKPSVPDSGASSEPPRAITKILLPSKRGNLLHRPRLVDFLHENIERKLLLISASAGYGKTSLLIDFAHETSLPVCWYSLDSADSDPRTFLEYIVASLKSRFPDFGARTLSLLSNPASLRDPQVIVGSLVTEIYECIPRYFVLILDDYHTVEESEQVHRILDTLLRLLPENAHLILSSRSLPSQLTLTRLVARQEIAGLGVNDLRFTAAEIQSLVRQNYQSDLSEEQAAELAERSEGWITGILLTTHSLWRGLFHDMVKLQGLHSHVFSYLANEVLAQQPPNVQRFLLDSSILDQLSPELCNGLLETRDADAMLRLVEQKNLFVSRLEEDKAWYRYHHLFQEFLQSRLMESDPARWKTLHQRAAHLYRAQSTWDRVIHHHLKSESFGDAACVIEQIARASFDAGHWTTLARWIDALPPDQLESHPDLLVWRATVFNDTGDTDRALDLYARALTCFESDGNAHGIGKALVKQAVAWRFRGRYQEAIENCERALTLFAPNSTADIAEAHRIMGISYGLQGNLARDVEELESALKLYETLNDFPRIAWLHHDLGVAYWTAGSTEGQRHFHLALDYWRRADNAAGLANTLNSIAVCYHREGKYDLAIETLDQARSAARRSGQLHTEAFTLASLGDVYRDKCEYASAQQAYQSAFEIARRINEGFIITYILCALGETFRLTGDLETADRLLHQALEQAESHRSNYEIGLTKTALGILCCEQGDSIGGAEHLSSAIDLLEQGGTKRDSARAHLHLAQAQFLQHRYRDATRHLRAAAELGTRLNDDQFVLADARQLLPLIKFALSKRIGETYFTRVLDKAERLRLSVLEPTKPVAVPVKLPKLEAFAFGTARLLIDGRLMTKAEWDSAATRELFFFLLAHPQGLRKEQIIGALWGEISPAKANGVFHSTVYRLRRAIFPECLLFEDGLYRISPDIDLGYDVGRFEKLLVQADYEKDQDDAADCLREAISLYQGEYFEDSYGDWSIPIRADLQRRYLDALQALEKYLVQRSDTEGAIDLCQRMLEKDNFREDVYRELMRLQMKAGNRNAALRTYQQCVDTLQDEAHLAPSSETQALFELIASGEIIR